MVFVRVHLIKGRLSVAQKQDLGAKLVQAVADVEGLVNNDYHKETSWVQFFEFEPENWYAPVNLPGADPDSGIQVDVITPQKLLATPEEARSMLGKANHATGRDSEHTSAPRPPNRPTRRWPSSTGPVATLAPD